MNLQKCHGHDCEKLKDYYHKYYQIKRSSILAKKKIYNDNNKEQIKEYRKKYWQVNKERLRIKHREYHRRRKNEVS
jgi:hypothetical protein